MQMMQFTWRDGPQIGVVALLLHRLRRFVHVPS